MELEPLQKRILDRAVDKQVVRRDAGLPAVEQLAESQTACGNIQISGCIDQTGAFAAESSVTGVRCSLAARMTSLPTVTPPVKKM